MLSIMLNFFLVAAILIIGDLFLRPIASSLFFLAANDVPLALAPLWIALPNLIFYIGVGALLAWRVRQYILVCLGIIFFLATLLMWKFQYPDGIWISQDFYAYSVALSPIIALPVGILLGFFFTKGLIMWRMKNPSI